MHITVFNCHKKLRELSLPRPYIILLIGKFWIVQDQEMPIILEKALAFSKAQWKSATVWCLKW